MKDKIGRQAHELVMLFLREGCPADVIGDAVREVVPAPIDKRVGEPTWDLVDRVYRWARDPENKVQAEALRDARMKVLSKVMREIVRMAAAEIKLMDEQDMVAEFLKGCDGGQVWTELDV